ncbi:MAG: septum formation protein Maf [Parachlamydiaceae bacterium]|nr:septum formation protein Maf [Parachlamydiaceae bacterium]
MTSLPIPQIILGSQSPRRKEIMSYFSLPFMQASPHYDEDAIPFPGDPIHFVNTLSKGKADSLHPLYPNSIIITADTTVYRHGKNYGKPRNDVEAFAFLKELAGNWHSVFTGLTVRYQNKEFQDVSETRVLFNPLSDKQIHAYYQKLPYTDKAGGYMIQQAGGIIVQKIDGCYYNVMGFPINSLHKLLLNIDLDLWDYIQ